MEETLAKLNWLKQVLDEVELIKDGFIYRNVKVEFGDRVRVTVDGEVALNLDKLLINSEEQYDSNKRYAGKTSKGNKTNPNPNPRCSGGCKSGNYIERAFSRT